METLTVTCIKPIRGGFLQIYGHKKPDLLDQLDSEIAAYQPSIKKLAAQNELYPNLEFDTIYLAHQTSTGKYHRCTVREKRSGNKAIIELIDYGNEYEIDASLLLELDPKNKIADFLKVFPAIATSYILANFFCTWKFNEFQIIESMLSKSRLPITNEQMDRDLRFISLNFKDDDLASKLIRSKIGMEISFTEQRIEIRKPFERAFGLFTNGPAASPARREKRRNLVPNRPLQTATNNNTITNQSKRMIQSVVLSNKPNAQRSSYHQEATVVDGITHSAPSRIPAFIATELSVGTFHAVYCSYVEDGPNLFWVSLRSQEHYLDRMSTELGNSPRNPITTKLSIGMACIARFSEDRLLYRAVIQKIQSDGCRVTFIDYGNSEYVAFADMYEIPNHFLEPKTFAMSFQLFGCKELGAINDRLKAFFNSLVENGTTLDLRVIPTRNVQVQQCELFIANGKNILELLKEKKEELSSFPNSPHLKSDDFVVIRAALTANKFYVQRVKDIPAFDEMMDGLFTSCLGTPAMASLPANGKCCAAMANGDNKEWYRAIVLSQLDSQRVQVQFVDYGNEMACRLTDLREIAPQFLSLPRQAIECCLVDFEDVADVSETTSKQLSMLIEDSDGKTMEYKASVKKRLPEGAYVVDLYNAAKELSVSLSVYKLAMPRRHYNKPPKATNEVEKPARALPINRSNSQNVRECDGAENQERFHETNANADGRPMDRQTDRQMDRPMDQYSENRNGNEDNTRFDRAKPNKPRNDSPKMPSNGSPRSYGNRPDYDNRRNGDTNKRSILQKHIIPRFNKRPNRSRNNHNGKRMMGVDKNDNWECTVGDSSSGLSSTDSASKTPEPAINKPKFIPITTEDFVGFNPTIPDAIPFPLNSSSKMNFVYWNSPFEFFMQLKSMESKCEEMMHQIQQYYRKRAAIQQKVSIGSLVIVRHKEDRVIKRARVIDYNQARDKYRVQFIDYGNKAVCGLSDMHEMEKSFTRLPAMAICCSLEPTVLNKSSMEIQEKVLPILENAVNIECKMIQQDPEKGTVEVHVDGTNLKDLLIRDMLLINLPKDICLERLVGQTLMAHVTAVTDLNSFQATFYGCDIAFMCSYKDLSLVKKNPQLSEQLRAAEQKYVRVKVESIGKDNVLMMSIYLPHLDNDADLPDICSYPIFSNEFDGIITLVEPPCTVYVQNRAFEGQEQQFLNDLYGAYENAGIVCPAPKLNQTYVVMAPADENYYRCRIERFLNDDEVSVRLIDYGNVEVVQKSSLKELTDNFKAPISVLAQKMLMPVEFVDGSTLANLDWNIKPKVSILGTYETHFMCDLSANGISMITALEGSNKAKRLDVNQLKELIEREMQLVESESNAAEIPVVAEVAPVEEAVPVVEVSPAEEVARVEEVAPVDGNILAKRFASVDLSTIAAESTMDVSSVSKADDESPTKRDIAFITHVDHPNRFYIQLHIDEAALESFQLSLQIVAPQLPALTVFRAGEMCIGKYSLDDQWYRAKIIDSDGDVTSIQFIDYGNTDSITDNSLLKATDSSLSAREPFAMACSLPIAPRDSSTEWAESACSKLTVLMNDSPVEFEPICKDNDVSYVKVFTEDGRDLVKELIQEEVADPLEIIKSGEKCFISHINSLDDFFIQVESDTEVLQKIEIHLEQNSGSEVLKEPTDGTICSARFEDGKFYRARILRVLAQTNGYDVEFLDYGNTFETTEVRTLMPEIANLPHLRKRCSLKMPNDIDEWSTEAVQRFREIADDGATEFTVRLIKPGKKAFVELYLGDENISDKLGELCEKKPTPPPMVIDEQESTFNENTSSHSINVNDFPSGKQPCLLTFATSPADFYIHFHSKMDVLRMIEAELAKVDENTEALTEDSIEVGSMVAALYPEDRYYYRAKVLAKLPHGINVSFIDYGNTCVVTKIRKLPVIVSTIIPLAAHCTLTNDKLVQFTEGEKNRFLDLIGEDPEPTFHVEAISHTLTKSTVQLYRDDVDVHDYIKGLQASPDATTVEASILSDIIEEATAE